MAVTMNTTGAAAATTIQLRLTIILVIPIVDAYVQKTDVKRWRNIKYTLYPLQPM